MTEDKMVVWHHQFNGHELGQTLGVGEGQRPVVRQFMGSQRIRHDLATEQQEASDNFAVSFYADMPEAFT